MYRMGPNRPEGTELLSLKLKPFLKVIYISLFLQIYNVINFCVFD